MTTFLIALLLALQGVAAAPAPATAPATEPAAAADPRGDFDPRWVAGQSWKLETLLERTDALPGGQPSVQALEVPVTLSVVSAGAGGAELAWTEGAAHVRSVGVDPARMVPLHLAAKAAEGVTTRLTTDASGRPTGVANVDELTARLKSVLEQIGATDDPAAGAAAKAMAGLTSPAVVTASALRTPQLLLAWAGVELAPGEANTSATSLDNPLGGPPLAGKLTLSRDASPPGATTATLRRLQAIDPEGASESLRQTLSLLGVPAEELSRFPVEITDQGTWIVSLRTGMPESVDLLRTIRIGPQERLERRRITVTAAAPGSPPPGAPAPGE